MAKRVDKAALGGVHLLLGPEAGLKAAFVAELQQVAADVHGEVETSRLFPYELDVVELVATLRTPSLFSAHHIVLLQEAQDLKAGTGAGALAEYCKAPGSDATLVLSSDGYAGDLPAALARSAPKARTQVFWEMFEDAKGRWVMQFFRDRHIEISPEAAGLLLEMVPNNTAELEAQCALIAAFYGGGASLEATDLDQYLYHGKQENPFTLFDRVARRDLQGALESLAIVLLARRAEPVQLLVALLSQFQKLADLKHLVAGGEQISAAMRKLRIHSKRMQQTYREADAAYDLGEVEAVHAALVEFDSRLRLFSSELAPALLQLAVYHAVVPGGRAALRPARV